jgi:hypothetical protein
MPGAPQNGQPVPPSAPLPSAPSSGSRQPVPSSGFSPNPNCQPSLAPHASPPGHRFRFLPGDRLPFPSGLRRGQALVIGLKATSGTVPWGDRLPFSFRRLSHRQAPSSDSGSPPKPVPRLEPLRPVPRPAASVSAPEGDRLPFSVWELPPGTGSPLGIEIEPIGGRRYEVPARRQAPPMLLQAASPSAFAKRGRIGGAAAQREQPNRIRL